MSSTAHRWTWLGYGAATSIGANITVGYDCGIRAAVPDPLQSHHCSAMKWSNGKAVALGQGVAYAIDRLGDVVGDDQSLPESNGYPTLWRRGRATRLSDRLGFAATGDERNLVAGALGDKSGNAQRTEAFIADISGAVARVSIVDDIVKGSGWHVSAIYGEANDGRLLGVGTLHNGTLPRGSNCSAIGRAEAVIP